MAKLRQIALNNNAGAFVDVLATVPCRSMQIMEDEGGTGPQGIQVKSILDGFNTTNTFSFGSEPAIIEDRIPIGRGHSPVLGYPAQNSANGSGSFNFRAADKIISARSNSATATTIRVIEDN